MNLSLHGAKSIKRAIDKILIMNAKGVNDALDVLMPDIYGINACLCSAHVDIRV